MNRILEMYESLELPCDIIAEELGISEDEVRGILSKKSTSFQAEVHMGQEWISKDSIKVVQQSYMNLGLHAENESVREKALRFMIEEENGRNERKVAAKTEEKSPTSINIIGQINASLREARKAIEGPEPIDVEVEEVKA